MTSCDEYSTVEMTHRMKNCYFAFANAIKLFIVFFKENNNNNTAIVVPTNNGGLINGFR
jgi:hypothetical protein